MGQRGYYFVNEAGLVSADLQLVRRGYSLRRENGCGIMMSPSEVEDNTVVRWERYPGS